MYQSHAYSLSLFFTIKNRVSFQKRDHSRIHSLTGIKTLKLSFLRMLEDDLIFAMNERMRILE